MPRQDSKDIKEELTLPLHKIKKEQYSELNIAFCLMSIIPFLVFIYLLATRLFSIQILIGDVGIALIIAFALSISGYWVGYSIVHKLLNKIITYSEKIKAAYHQIKETQEILIQSEKFKAIGQLASGIAHEVKNPLAIILQDINYLEEKKPAGEEYDYILKMMKRSMDRADNIINVLVDFSKVERLKIEPLDINLIIEKSLLLIQYKVKFGNVEFTKEFDGNLPKVLVDGIKTGQVFVNLFLNAIQAMPQGGRLFIRTSQKKMEMTEFRVGRRKNEDFFEPGEAAVVVEIEDTGNGITQEDLSKVFDPFFTTKSPREGMGLGLSVTKSIVELQKGIITISSSQGHGAKATIIFKSFGGKNGE